MLFSVEQAFVGREEIRAPLKTPTWEAKVRLYLQESSKGLLLQDNIIYSLAALTKFRSNQPAVTIPLKF